MPSVMSGGKKGTMNVQRCAKSGGSKHVHLHRKKKWQNYTNTLGAKDSLRVEGLCVISIFFIIVCVF